MEVTFTPYVAFAVEGARVALVSCTVCGAAILLSPHDVVSTTALHVAWHQTQ